MKKKAFDKRLVLKKKTIAHLDNNEMKGLHGRAGLTSPT
ncbi:MAG: class I lanthipeptide, partial [Candidatus Aminicenantes bacterium]